MKVGVKLNNIEVFFSRPGEMSEIKDRLMTDIKHAKQRIHIAMAYINDDEIINSINKTLNSPEKKFVFNKQTKSIDKIINCRINSVILNNDKSLMHHKFWIIDDTVWVGSFNSTDYASEIHWENIIRIKKPEITAHFVEEFNKMYIIGMVIKQQGKPIYKISELVEGEKTFDTICNLCKDTYNAEFNIENNGVIDTDVWDHYYFSIEHLQLTN